MAKYSVLYDNDTHQFIEFSAADVANIRKAYETDSNTVFLDSGFFSLAGVRYIIKVQEIQEQESYNPEMTSEQKEYMRLQQKANEWVGGLDG